MIGQCDLKNEIKISASYNDKFLALTLTGLTGYSTGDDYGYKKESIHKGGFASFYVLNQSFSLNGPLVLTY